MLKMVLDTNVVISALLKTQSTPALIVSLALQGRIIFCLSENIFNEYEGVLAREKFKALNSRQVKRLLAELKNKALFVVPEKKLEIIKEDPEDNMFLECALEAEADFLITGNKKHFPFKTFKGISVVSPGEFINVVAEFLFE
ncbi:MAG: putative toxin-antitoxin system toxin component, PIN family [Deltaproteobacteria bacterium]|nr:putative toxin-antitoxin system toxin component, PIN family [Deltaproteobacteria bacterium]